MEHLAQHIESLIFTCEQPITAEEIRDCLEEVFESQVRMVHIQEALEQLTARYQQLDTALELVEIAKGFQFLTKGAYHHTIGTYLRLTTKKRLSRAALETLSILAYKQPVTKTEIEKIRGVNCDYAVQKLLEKELVTITGRSEGPGRPLLYATSERFMDYFGLKSLEDLPKTKDFKMPENTVGEAAPIEESVDAEEAANKVEGESQEGEDQAVTVAEEQSMEAEERPLEAEVEHTAEAEAPPVAETGELEATDAPSSEARQEEE
ncbi:MAG: SMC-Scp complex subunit ScpB [Bacteroidota bacterium]